MICHLILRRLRRILCADLYRQIRAQREMIRELMATADHQKERISILESELFEDEWLSDLHTWTFKRPGNVINEIETWLKEGNDDANGTITK